MNSTILQDFLGKLKFKDRTRLLYVLMVVVFWLIFIISVKPAFEKYQLLQNNKTQLKEISGLSDKIKEIKSELNQLDNILGLANTENIKDGRGILLQAISDYCNKKNVRIDKIDQPEDIKQNNVRVELNKIALKGRFKDLMKFVYYMEEHKELSHIASLTFDLKKDYASKKESLELSLYFKLVKEKTVESDNK